MNSVLLADLHQMTGSGRPASELARVHAQTALEALRTRDYKTALASAEAALAYDPDCPAALVTLAGIHIFVGNFDKAETCARRAMCDPAMKLHATEMLARALFHQGRYEGEGSPLRRDAQVLIEGLLAKAAAFVPIDNFLLLQCLAQIYYKLGRYDLAYKLYDELRYSPECEPPYPWTEAPIWDGSDPKGKTIFVRHVDGLGDFIQNLRYLSTLLKLGCHVILETPARLLPLVQSAEGLEVLPKDEAPGHHDYSVAFSSVPGLCGLRSPENVFWPGPYVHVPPSKTEQWSERILREAPTSLRVGICWAAAGASRRIRFVELGPLLSCPGVTWFSVQRGPCATDAEGMLTVEDPDGSVLDTAAALQNLDLLVTVDSFPAHLAGALGVPTWLVLHAGADMRWMKDRADTAWYPAMRIFRQARPGDWSVLQRVREALEELLA